MNIFFYSNPTESGEHTFHTHIHESIHAEQDWKSLRPYFGWQSEQVIQDAHKVMSRFAGTIPHHEYLKKSRNPVFYIPRRNEPVATDTIFSDTLAINDGSTMAQFLLARILWYVMHMGSKVRNSLSTHFMITSSPEDL